MSSLWVLGLGASVGYLYFKRQQVGSRLEAAVREHDMHLAAPGTTTDGVTWSEVKQRWKDGPREDEATIDPKLPKEDRARLLQGQAQAAQERADFNAAADPPVGRIEGVWCETRRSS